MRILVCGGRDFKDKDIVYQHLLPYLEKYDKDLEIISGMAKGVDAFGYEFAKDHGLICHEFHANWKAYGNGAGPKRNQRMLDEGKPDLVISFPGGTGTNDMVFRAKIDGIKVVRIET